MINMKKLKTVPDTGNQDQFDRLEAIIQIQRNRRLYAVKKGFFMEEEYIKSLDKEIENYKKSNVNGRFPVRIYLGGELLEALKKKGRAITDNYPVMGKETLLDNKVMLNHKPELDDWNFTMHP